MELFGKRKKADWILIETEETKTPIRYRLMSKKKIRKKLKDFYARPIIEKKQTVIETPRGKIVF